MPDEIVSINQYTTVRVDQSLDFDVSIVFQIEVDLRHIINMSTNLLVNFKMAYRALVMVERRNDVIFTKGRMGCEEGRANPKTAPSSHNKRMQTDRQTKWQLQTETIRWHGHPGWK